MTLKDAAEPSAALQNDATPAPKEPQTPEAQPNQDAPEPAASSPAEGAKPNSLLDIVKSVVEPKEEKAAESPTREQAAEQTEGKPADSSNAPSSDGSDAKPSEEEPDEKLPFHKHPRWREVIAERDSYKADASQFRAIADYMAQTRLTTDEVNKGFEIMSALKNNPLKAREMLADTMRQLDILAGEVLPQDLSQKVDAGDITPDAAKELARTRSELAIAQQQQQAFLAAQQQQTAATAQQGIKSAVDTWEQTVAAKDPDYEAKRQLVFKNIRLAHLENPARTPQEALAIAEAAYKDATETLKGLLPKRGTIKTPTSQQTIAQAKPQPKSLRDVVNLAAGL